MFKLIEFLKKRPSDMTIRAIRTLFSLAVAAMLVYAKGQFVLPFQSYYAMYAEYVTYAVAALFVIHALVFGILGLCVYQRPTMKKMQMLAGLGMILLGSMITYVPATVTTDATQTVELSSLAQKASTPISVGGWIIFYGAFALIAGISGKMITGSCMKYKEVITKIRV